MKRSLVAPNSLKECIETDKMTKRKCYWHHGDSRFSGLLYCCQSIYAMCLINDNTGPCIINGFATRRKNFSQWHRSFQRKLRSHWLKFLRHVAITLVIQGPGLFCYGYVILLLHSCHYVTHFFQNCFNGTGATHTTERIFVAHWASV